MTDRSTKGSISRSRSKAGTKAVELASVPPKTAVSKAVKLVDKGSTRAAAASKTVKKGVVTVRAAEASAPRSPAGTAAKGVARASIPPKIAPNEAMKLVNKSSNQAAAASGAVKKKTAMAARSTKVSGPLSQPEVAAIAAKLAPIPLKSAANEALKLADKASTEVAAASEAVKEETVYAVDTYKEAAAETLDNTEEIVKAAGEVVTGVTEIHQTMWNSLQRMIQAAVEMPTQFATCTSFADLAETQRAVMRRGFNEWLNISQEILMANRRIADRAINALELR